jgi:cell division protein ZapB
MNTQILDQTLSTQLSTIENRVERLLGLVEKLATENADLKKQEKSLVQECQDLRSRHEKASSQLEAMIQRLKHQPTTSEA